MKKSALLFLSVLHIGLAINAQYEWRLNSAGRYVYVKTVTVNTGASTSTKTSGGSTTTSSKNKYESVIVFNEKFAAVSKNGKYGFINEYDKLVIPFTYDYADNFFQGRALVKLYGQYGFINTSGKVVVPLIYDMAERFEGYSTKVEKGNLRYTIDQNGKTISTAVEINPTPKKPVSYSYKGEYVDGIARIIISSKYGYVDSFDNIVVPAIYEQIQFFHKTHSATANLNGKWGLINRAGKTILPFIYDDLFKENAFFRASMKNKWGTIDSLGKIKIPFTYEKMEYFWVGLAPVQLNKKWGYINEKGKVIIPIKYDYAGPYNRFKDELFVVGIKNKRGVINKSNKIVLPLIYDVVELTYGGDINATLGKDSFYFDGKGKSIIREQKSLPGN